MSKPFFFITRLINRKGSGETIEIDEQNELLPPDIDQLTICKNGRKYRVQKINGRWVRTGPSLGPCTEVEDDA